MSMTGTLMTVESLVIFAYLLLNAIYCFTSKDYNFENKIILNEISESLNSKLIYSFRTNTKCEPTEEILVLDKFNSIEGCGCEKVFYKGDDDCSKKCKYVKINYKELTRINHEQICVTKSKTYLDILKEEYIISKGETCPLNYTFCGTIDSIDRKLCVEEGNKCPLKLNDININISPDNTDLASIFKLDQISPCMNSTNKNWDFYGNLKGLTDSYEYSVKGKLYDIRYQKLGISSSQYDLYEDNGLLESIKSYNAEDYDLQNKYINLFAKNFIGLDLQKALEFSKEDLISREDTLNNCIWGMRVASIILGAPFFCLGMCFGAAGYGGGNINCPSSFGGSSDRLFFIFLGFTSPFSITYFIESIIIFYNHVKVKSMVDFGSDKYTEKLINSMFVEVNANYGCSLATIIIFPIIIVILLFYAYYYYKKNR